MKNGHYNKECPITFLKIVHYLIVSAQSFYVTLYGEMLHKLCIIFLCCQKFQNSHYMGKCWLFFTEFLMNELLIFFKGKLRA